MCGEDGESNPPFSKRELEVLGLLPGRQDKEIASALDLSAHGVRYHLRSLFAKLDASTRTEAIGRARQMGLIADDS